MRREAESEVEAKQLTLDSLRALDDSIFDLLQPDLRQQQHHHVDAASGQQGILPA